MHTKRAYAAEKSIFDDENQKKINKWDKSIPVEENMYYWKGSPIIFGHPTDARGLTIRERCRLQSFPDDFVVSGGIVQGRVQTGNAVPPLLAKAVALAIKKHL